MASNVVSTSGSTRANMGASTVLTGVLKDVYLEGMTNTVFFDNAFTRLIQPKTAKLDATGRRIVHAFDTQRSAGVGAFAEGGDFKASRPIDATQGYEWLKYYNAYFQVTGPAAATVKAGEGSYVDIVSKHMKSMIKSAKMDVERVCMGQADGRLGDCANSPTSGADIQVDGPAFFDTQYFEPGMYVEYHDDGGFGTIYDYDGSTAYHEVSSLTTGNKRTSTAGVLTMGADFTGATELTAGDHICRRGSYTSTTCLEGNGLMNLVSDGASTTSTYHGAESGNNYKYVWPSASSSGIDRTSYGYVCSQVVDISGELYEEKLLEVLIENEFQYQATPNLLIVSPRAVLKYFGNEEGIRRFNVIGAMDWTGGYKGLGIQLGSKQYMLTTLASVPEGIGFLINTKDFAFMRPPGMSGYKWLTSDSGQILRSKEGSDNYFATAVDYMQMVCFDPGKQAKMYGIVEV